jgi:vacuolar protein sorting-associated protein 13A/C
MRIRLSAPVELENLLPYDFKYRIYDKNTKKDWTNFLRKGGLSPVHVVELSHLLLLSVDMQDTVFKASDFAIINSNNQEDFRRELRLVCKDQEGLSLNLNLQYYKIPNGGGAFRVTVFSPYVILNKTGLDINIRAKSLLQGPKTAAGQSFNSATDGSDHKALPYMFAFGSDDQRNRALLRVGESSWSKPQSFDAIGSVTDVVLPSATKNTEIHIGILVKQGEGKYHMTKVVTLAPRFVLKNQMNEEINVREPGSSELFTLGPKALQPLHFLQKSVLKQLSLCFPGVNNQWSSPFNISNLGTTHVKIAKVGQRQKLIRIEVLMENATIFLHISAETKNWPFSIRNESDTEFMFYQANPNIDDDNVEDRSGWRPIRYRLPPRSIMPYSWDYPAAKQKELVINANGKERHIKLAEIGNLIPMKIPASPNAQGAYAGGQKIIELNVAADGPTQTLILSNYKQSKSLYKQNSRAESSTSVAGGFEVKDQDTGINFRAQLKLAGFGISLINHQMKELAYITFRDIELKYSESPLFQTVAASIKWIQVDNQLYGGVFPMILYPSVVPKNTGETETHPSIHFMVTRVKDDSYGVIYIKYATMLLQQMTLEIDEDFIFSLLEFTKVPGASWSEEHEGVLCDESLDIPEPKQEQQDQDIYFELLNIQPMQLDISFVRTDRVNSEEDTSAARNPATFFLNVVTMAIGNINDAPVRLNALLLENARVAVGVLWQSIYSHYSQEGIYQMHKIIGSADFLGNPVGLFNNLSSGVADIFYEPYQGFIMSADNPEQLGIGIAKGATSFIKKSVFGFSDSFSKVTGSIAKGLAEATMDKQFQDRRRMTRSRNRPKHALYGVTAGANSFVSSVASGVGGLARKPMEGAEQEGAAGFFKGVGKGLLGLATKPAIGVFDLASNVSEGIRNTTTVFDADGLDRVRLTRFIGTDGIVRPYSQREALGQFWLKQLDSGKYFNEQYIAHLELPREDVVVMLTYSRIMLIKSKKLTSEWDVPLKDIQTISKERTGLSLTLRGGTNGPFIPVAEESSRNFLYRKIGVAVGYVSVRCCFYERVSLTIYTQRV